MLSRTATEDSDMPLTAPRRRPSDPIAVDHRSITGQPEATQSRGVPAWLLASIREAGREMVLTRQAWGGVAPAADRIAAALSLIWRGAATVTFGMAALSFHLAGNGMLKPAGR